MSVADEAFEPDVARNESVALVEPMGVTSRDIRGELDSVATGLAGELDRLVQEVSSDALSARVRVHVERFDLGTKATAPLKMTEHDQLAQTYDFTIRLGYEQVVPVRRLDVAQSSEIRVRIRSTFLLSLQRSLFQKPNQPLHVTRMGTPDDDLLHRVQYARGRIVGSGLVRRFVGHLARDGAHKPRDDQLLSRPESLELLCAWNWVEPRVPPRGMELGRRRRKIRVGEIADGDRKHRAAFERPIQGGSASRAEVITHIVTGRSADAVGLDAVVDRGLAFDLHRLFLRENCAHLEHASGAPLAKLAMAGHYSHRFSLERDSCTPTCTFGRSYHCPPAWCCFAERSTVGSRGTSAGDSGDRPCHLSKTGDDPSSSGISASGKLRCLEAVTSHQQPDAGLRPISPIMVAQTSVAIEDVESVLCR